MIVYKDVLGKLKKAGYSTYYLTKHKILSTNTLQKLRNGEFVTLSTLDTICRLTNSQPADLIEYRPDDVYYDTYV